MLKKAAILLLLLVACSSSQSPPTSPSLSTKPSETRQTILSFPIKDIPPENDRNTYVRILIDSRLSPDTIDAMYFDLTSADQGYVEVGQYIAGIRRINDYPIRVSVLWGGIRIDDTDGRLKDLVLVVVLR